MSANKFRIHYEAEWKCRCGRWLAHRKQDCAVCALRKEQRDAAKVKAELRAKLDRRRYEYNEHGQPI